VTPPAKENIQRKFRIVVVDTSKRYRDEDRPIVVEEVDTSIRTADWTERRTLMTLYRFEEDVDLMRYVTTNIIWRDERCFRSKQTLFEEMNVLWDERCFKNKETLFDAMRDVFEQTNTLMI
jgi:hypothetical protein